MMIGNAVFGYTFSPFIIAFLISLALPDSTMDPLFAFSRIIPWWMVDHYLNRNKERPI